jgi:hypothetical protein
MSSPMIALHVELGGFLRADREEVQQHLGARLPQRFHDIVVRRVGAFVQHEASRSHSGHMGSHAIENASADDPGTRWLDIRVEDGGVVGGCEYRLGDVQADLPRIDVDTEHDFHITRAIATDMRLDQASRRTGTSIERCPLHQRTGAIADPDHRNFNRFHQTLSLPQETSRARSRLPSGKGPQQLVRVRSRFTDLIGLDGAIGMQPWLLLRKILTVAAGLLRHIQAPHSRLVGDAVAKR